MSAKGRNVSMKENKWRSSLPEKQWKSPDPPSTLERKKALASAESRKIPIYYKHTVCSLLYAQNHKRQYPFDITKLQGKSLDKHVSHSKSSSTKTKATKSSTKEIGSTRPKEVGKPRSLLTLKNSVDITVTNINIIRQMRQPAKGLGRKTVVAEKKSRLSNDLSSSKDDHNIVIHEEVYKLHPIVDTDILVLDNCDKQHMDVEGVELLHNVMEDEGLGGDQDMPDSNTCSEGNNTYDVASEVDQETKTVAQEVGIGANDIEHDLKNEERNINELAHGEPTSKVVEMEECVEEIPIEEDLISKVVVKNQHVVTNGKKDTAAYTNAIEGAGSELLEQRSNRVKALVGAFENVISSESHVLQKRSFHFK